MRLDRAYCTFELILHTSMYDVFPSHGSVRTVVRGRRTVTFCSVLGWLHNEILNSSRSAKHTHQALQKPA